MAADLQRDTADLRFPVALHGLFEGPPPLFRDGLPPHLQIYLIAVVPAAVGVTGLISEGWQDPHQRVLWRDFHWHPQQVKVTRPVHKVLVEWTEMGQFLRGQRGVTCPVQRKDNRPGLLTHRVRWHNIGHLAGGVSFQILIVNGIDLSGIGFHGFTLPSSVFL